MRKLILFLLTCTTNTYGLDFLRTIFGCHRHAPATTESFWQPSGPLRDVEVKNLGYAPWRIIQAYEIQPENPKFTGIQGKGRRFQSERDWDQAVLNARSLTRTTAYKGHEMRRIWRSNMSPDFCHTMANSLLHQHVVKRLNQTPARVVADPIMIEYILHMLLPDTHQFHQVAPRIRDYIDDNDISQAARFALMLLAVRRGYSFTSFKEDNVIVRSNLEIGAEKNLIFQAHGLSEPVPENDSHKARNQALQDRLCRHIMQDKL